MYNILCCNSNRVVEWSVTMKIKKDWKSDDFQSFGGAQERTIISVFKNGLLLVNNLIHKLLVLYQKC